MGSIHINRNRQSLGQFSDQEVADGLQSGRFRPDDLAWHASMDSWQPLSTFKNLPPASETPSAPLPAPNVPPIPTTGAAPVWESAEPKPLVPAAVETIKQILSNPVETFRAMPAGGGLSKPLKFYVLVSWISSSIALLYECVAILINPQVLAGGEFKNLPQYEVFLILFGLLLILPVILFVRSFIASGIIHLALLLVGGATKPFETTFRVVCYASGATSVLQVVPICGPWFYLAASLVYSVIGLKEAHRTDLWRPILAVFLILIVSSAAAIGILFLGYSAIGAAAK